MSSWTHVILQVSIYRSHWSLNSHSSHLCHPTGAIVRQTVAKSQSKQAYYDARKVNWGDLFPHPSKGKETVRDRGIKRLNKVQQPEGVQSQVAEEDDLADIPVEEDWPVARLVNVADHEGQADNGKGEEDVIVRTYGQT